MGFNTVAFLLNDFMHCIEKSPLTVSWALSHPPYSKQSINSWRDQVDRYADECGEPSLHSQALEVLPTFHADGHKWLFAGGNTIAELKFVRFGKDKDGGRTVTLKLPDWWRQ